MRILLSFLILLVAGNCWAGSVTSHPKVTGIQDAFGPLTFTVGNGGDYANLEEAFKFLDTLPLNEVSVSGTISASPNDYLLTGTGTAFTTEIQAGDLIVLDGEVKDSVAFFDIAPFWHGVWRQPFTDTELEMSFPVVNGTLTGTYTVYRPTKVTLLVLAGGTVETGVNISIPAGLDLTITSAGSIASTITCTVSSGISFITPKYGYLTFENISVNTLGSTAYFMRNPQTTDVGDGWNSSLPTAQGGDTHYKLVNVTANGANGPMFDMKGTSIEIIGCFFRSSSGGTLNGLADYINIMNVQSFGDLTGDNIVLSAQGSFRPNQVRPSSIMNVFVERKNSIATGTGACLEWGSNGGINGHTNPKYYYMTNVTVLDWDQGNANDSAVSLFVDVDNSTTYHRVSNVVIEHTRSGGDGKYFNLDSGAVGGFSNPNVVMTNVVNREGINLWSTQTMTASGAIYPHYQQAHLNSTTPLIAATIADAATHEGTFYVKQIDTGTAGHTVTLTAGTWDGTNTVATFNADNDYLLVYFDSEGRGTIITNNGVVLS